MFEVKPVKQLEGNRSEVAITRWIGNKKNASTRHFSVQNEKVDEFVSDYKNHLKSNTILGASITLLSAMGGGLLGGKIIKKFYIGNILGSLLFAIEGMNYFSKNFFKKDKALLDKHNVQEIFYLKENKATAK